MDSDRGGNIKKFRQVIPLMKDALISPTAVARFAFCQTRRVTAIALLRDTGQSACGLQRQAFGGHRRVDIHFQRGLDIGVAQDFRQGFHVHTTLYAAGGKRMANRVVVPGRNIQ